MEKSDVHRINGIIIPDSWDPDGRVTQVALATYHEEKFLIVDDAKGKELLTYLRGKMVVEGRIVSRGTARAIAVISFYVDASDSGAIFQERETNG